MTAEPMTTRPAPGGDPKQTWWESLRHFGLLLGPSQVAELEARPLEPLPDFRAHQLRRELARFEAGDITDGALVAWILETIGGFEHHVEGRWARGKDVPVEWRHDLVTGESLRPRHVWTGPHDAALPIFFETRSSHRLGLYKGRKTVSDVVQWLRAAGRPLALLTNGRQLRLLHAGLDFHSACEWDFEALFEAGKPGPQLEALRRLLTPRMLTPPEEGAEAPLLELIHASRRGQSELSSELGERVRDAVEILVRGHGPSLSASDLRHDGKAIYRAAVRVVMRMVFLFFAESRELLPRSNPIYSHHYSLHDLFEHLGRLASQGEVRLRHRYSAWPRILALFRLVHDGAHHEALQVPAYGGDLFAPGDRNHEQPWRRALHLFETACFAGELMSDLTVHRILERLARARIRIRQGHAATWTTVPVDFSDLSSEYIGILYEGLLDYELKQAPEDDSIVFLAVGNEPALPLRRLEGMSDKQIRELFENLKDKSGTSDDEELSEELEEVEEEDDEAEDESEPEPEEEREEVAAVEADEDTTIPEAREQARTRAHAWTRHACEVARLVKKPRGKMTPEKRRSYQAEVERKAERMIRDVFLPGDWYLVRWGGTRKGAGTYYTRPQLAVPLVHRTLRPLAQDPPVGEDGAPDTEAPAERWTPKTPEEILALKVCDPACGSGTFPLSALRYLTEALYASLFHHGRLHKDHDQTLVHLLGQRPASEDDRLSDERIPCRPDADDFEPRLKARLRRHVVERCIYGVDLDPLAVELCKLALWIETMDRDLPFTFLDHKVKVGNSLVGCWFDRFQHYPPMAWKRDAGDKGHTNGGHFKKEERSKAIKARCGNTTIKDRDTVRLNLLHLLEEAASGQMQLFSSEDLELATGAHDDALTTLSAIHEMSVVDSEEKARRYRQEVVGSTSWRSVKERFDLWCALWFWPAGEIEEAPLPTEFLAPDDDLLRKVRDIARDDLRFFHWELEFPDVFDRPNAGFDALTGNPPWEISKPNSKEFFSQLDPLYRSYGKQEAVAWQTEYFREDPSIEERWIEYNAGYRAMSNWVKYAAHPFGDVAQEDSDNFSLARGKKNKELHRYWADLRRKTTGYADPAHPYRHQGSADINLYKLFLETAHALLQHRGRLGFLVPSGLYSDHGTGDLRKLFLEDCRWEWLFGFENREKIFDIDSRFKFNPVIVEKGGTTDAIRTAFMHRRIEDWEEAEEHAFSYPQHTVKQLSPLHGCLFEIRSQKDLDVLEAIFSSGRVFAHSEQAGLKFTRELDKTNDSSKLKSRDWMETAGYLSPHDDPRESAVRRKLLDEGYTAIWEGKNCNFESWPKPPTIYAAVSDVSEYLDGLFPLGVRRVARNTDKRTLIGCIVPPLTPTMYTIEICRSLDFRNSLRLYALISSYVLDFVARFLVDSSVPISTLEALPDPQEPPPLTRLLARQVRFLLTLGPAGSGARRASLDAVVAAVFSLQWGHLAWILRDCDHPSSLLASKHEASRLPATGFWRVDKTRDPELRRTVLTLVAFADLLEKIQEQGGDREKGIEAFCTQNDGQGWILPETLCLSDYGLGHDDRAGRPQPVASRLGPRFYDWQLEQDPAESWRECELYARNFLGPNGYRELKANTDDGVQAKDHSRPQDLRVRNVDGQGDLF